MTGKWHSRSALAGLLWGDLPEEGARANLRLALTKLRKAAGEYLLVSQGAVALDCPATGSTGGSSSRP